MIAPSSEVQWKLNVVLLILALNYILYCVFMHELWSQRQA